MPRVQLRSAARAARARPAKVFLTVVTVVAVATVAAVPFTGADAVAATKRRVTTTRRAKPTRPSTTKRADTAKPVTTSKPPTTPSTTMTVATATLPVSALAVDSRMQTFVDPSRPTAATTASAAKPTRTLETLIVTPVDTGKRFPLVVFGHGLTGRPAQYEKLLRRIASAGFVVAAPTFPLSNTNAPGGPSLFDEPNQPGDMSFVITQLLTDKQVDSEWVFVSGHSLGAITTVDLIGNPAMVDERVDGAVVISGTANLFGSAMLFDKTPAVPVLFMHGDLDATVPISLGLSTYAAARSPKWFMTMIGGNHTFGIDGRADLAGEAGLLYTDAISAFLASVADGPQVVTAALRAVTSAHPSRLSLQSSATRG